MRRRTKLLACALLPVLLCSALWLTLPMGSSGAPAQSSLAKIQKKIDVTRWKIGRRKGTERNLSGDIAQWSAKINRLQSKISVLQTRQGALQSDLDARQAELAATQADLRAERQRLARLRARLAEGRAALANRLLDLFQADRPDLVSVVLNAHGFADLLERGEFLDRIREQDERIIGDVRTAQVDATATAKRLDALEERQQRLTAIVLKRRDEVAAVKQRLIDTRVGYQDTRQGKANALANIRSERHDLEEDLEAMQAASARIAEQLRAAQPGALPAGDIRQGSGSLVWPASGPITGVFGESRPGHMHAGIDIAIPEGTPLRAVDNGKVVLQQGVGVSGGYGNYTCIAISGSVSACYAHQSRFAASLGQSVTKGQVIGISGNTGNSTGPHLHFEIRVNGTPVNPMGYL